MHASPVVDRRTIELPGMFSFMSLDLVRGYLKRPMGRWADGTGKDVGDVQASRCSSMRCHHYASSPLATCIGICVRHSATQGKLNTP